MGRGRLGWKFADVRIFGQKKGLVFVVVGRSCGELLERKLGGLRR